LAPGREFQMMYTERVSPTLNGRAWPLAFAGQRSRRKAGRAGIWILVALPILAIPLENQYSLFGLSLAKLTIFPLLLAVVVLYPRRLLSIWTDPVLVAASAFLAWGAISEALRPLPDWDFLYRVFQVFVLVALVAAVPNNRVGLERMLLAAMVASGMLACYLVLNFYQLVTTNVTDYHTASQLRVQAFEQASLRSNLNILGYTVGIGAIVALARLLGARRFWAWMFWGAIYLLCAVGTTIPVSRGAFIALICASALLLARSLMRSRGFAKLALVIGLAIVLFSLMPDALTARLVFLQTGSEAQMQKQDARLRLLEAAVKSMPEYWAVGVGEGYYWGAWAAGKGFGQSTLAGTSVLGPHNGFLAAWIYFGMPGLGLLTLTCFFAARKCPHRANTTWEASALFGLACLGLQWLFFTHNLYLKEFGIILGLLIGGARVLALPRRSMIRGRRQSVQLQGTRTVTS